MWYVDSYPMCVFRWSPEFRSDVESSLVLIWVSFPYLPIFLFNKKCLFSIARMIGTIDLATVELSRPSVAKVSVQIDLLKKFPSKIWLECGDSIPEFWQPIVYDKIPKYFKYYMHLGHDIHACKVVHPPPPPAPEVTKAYKPKADVDPTQVQPDGNNATSSSLPSKGKAPSVPHTTAPQEKSFHIKSTYRKDTKCSIPHCPPSTPPSAQPDKEKMSSRSTSTHCKKILPLILHLQKPHMWVTILMKILRNKIIKNPNTLHINQQHLIQILLRLTLQMKMTSPLKTHLL